MMPQHFPLAFGVTIGYLTLLIINGCKTDLFSQVQIEEWVVIYYFCLLFSSRSDTVWGEVWNFPVLFVFCCSCFFNNVCFVLKFSKGFCLPRTCMQSTRLHINLWHLNLSRADTYFGPAYWTVSAYKVVVKQNAEFRSRLSCFCIKPPKNNGDWQAAQNDMHRGRVITWPSLCTFNFTGW